MCIYVEYEMRFSFAIEHFYAIIISDRKILLWLTGDWLMRVDYAVQREEPGPVKRTQACFRCDLIALVANEDWQMRISHG